MFVIHWVSVPDSLRSRRDDWLLSNGDMAQNGSQSDWSWLSGHINQCTIDRTKSDFMIALNCRLLSCLQMHFIYIHVKYYNSYWMYWTPTFEVFQDSKLNNKPLKQEETIWLRHKWPIDIYDKQLATYRRCTANIHLCCLLRLDWTTLIPIWARLRNSSVGNITHL